MSERKQLEFVQSDSLLGSFESYSQTILELVKRSRRGVSIGIYGEWGSGKTRLMKSIYDKLVSKLDEVGENTVIIPIWFNAWQYEQEEYLALFPLLRTITSGIDNSKLKNKINERNSNKLKDCMRAVLRGAIKTAPLVLSLAIPTATPDNITEFLEKGAKNFSGEFAKLVTNVTDVVDQNTTYATGLKAIEDVMKEIRINGDNRTNIKFVVFVDDADRCSPKKILETLDSVKMFLDIEGFVFILGISYNTLSNIIEKYYKDYDIKGKDYLRKIIDIPVFLPIWNKSDIKNLIVNLTKGLDPTYQTYIESNGDLIVDIADENPRETIAIVNNLIVMFLAYESVIEDAINRLGHISNKKKDDVVKQFVTLQVMNFRWNDLFQLILKAQPRNVKWFVTEIKKYKEKTTLSYRHKSILSLNIFLEFDVERRAIKHAIKKYEGDDKFSEFLSNNYETLSDILLLQKISRTDYNNYLELFKQNTKLTIRDSTKFTPIEEKRSDQKISSKSNRDRNIEIKRGFLSRFRGH